MGGLCGDSGDSGGDEMRRQEEERQARIREGTNRINQVFGGTLTKQSTVPVSTPKMVAEYENPNYGRDGSTRSGPGKTTYRQVYENVPTLQTSTENVPGQFTDDFYTGLKDTYENYYRPQLQRQEGDADRALKINLARSGNLTGSVGSRQIGRLAEDKATQERSLSDQAIKYSNDARTKNEQTRGNLIGQLESGAGIENVANQASAAAATATAPPAFSPLGDLFKNYTAAVANASLAAGNPAAFPGADQYRKSLLFNSGGNNSATVVN